MDHRLWEAVVEASNPSVPAKQFCPTAAVEFGVKHLLPQAQFNLPPAVQESGGILGCRFRLRDSGCGRPRRGPRVILLRSKGFSSCSCVQKFCKRGPACHEPVSSPHRRRQPGARFMVGGERSKANHVSFTNQSIWYARYQIME